MSDSKEDTMVERADEAIEACEPASAEDEGEFQQLKSRLEEIAAAVDGDDISLDEALDLYEEAVGLGLQAINILDVDITAQEEEQARMLEEGGETQAVPTEAQAAPDASAAELPDEAPQLAQDAGTAADESTLAGN